MLFSYIKVMKGSKILALRFFWVWGRGTKDKYV